jgi:hypothetical protein
MQTLGQLRQLWRCGPSEQQQQQQQQQQQKGAVVSSLTRVVCRIFDAACGSSWKVCTASAPLRPTLADAGFAQDHAEKGGKTTAEWKGM